MQQRQTQHTPRLLGGGYPSTNDPLLPSRLEELNEKRQGMIQRLKVVEKEKGLLEGKKAEAEEFLSKQAEMVKAKVSATTIYKGQSQVRGAWGNLGLVGGEGYYCR